MIKPVGSHILVEVEKKPAETNSGLELERAKVISYDCGVVAGLGIGNVYEQNHTSEIHPFFVKKGHRVYFDNRDKDCIVLNDIEYVVLVEKDILADLDA